MTQMTKERAIQIARIVLAEDTTHNISHFERDKAYNTLAEIQLPKDKSHKGLPVRGYAPTQSQEAVDLVNENKIVEENLLRLIDDLQDRRTSTGKLIEADSRWLAIARTELEKGFMALNRAIFKPGRVSLPDD